MTQHNSAKIPPELYSELRIAHKGHILHSTDPKFPAHARIWNGSIKTTAVLLCRPKDAQDVSAILKFCKASGLAPSIKAGGYNPAGWSITGEVIIDVSLIRGISIETPAISDGEENDKQSLPYISLRDQGSKESQDKPTAPLPSDTKRRKASEAFEEDEGEKKYVSGVDLLAADETGVTSQFLVGKLSLPETPLPKEVIPDPDRRPIVRRRREPPPARPEGVPDTEAVPYAREFGSSVSTIASDPVTLSPRIDRSYGVLTTSRSAPPGFIAHSTEEDVRLDPGASGGPLTAAEPFAYAFSSGPGRPFYPPLRMPTSFIYPTSLSSSSHHAANVPNFVSTASSSSITQHFVSPAAASQDSNGPVPAEQSITPTDVLAIPQVPYVYVSFGAGATQKDVDRYMAMHPITGVSSTNAETKIPYYVPFAAHPVGSSVMMLGGFGFLTRLHGLSIDALVEVEMVLADGTIVVANKVDHPDLFWAIRGAGPAFGVATRYVARAYPVPVCYAGNLVYNFNPYTAPALFKHVRDCGKSAPRELYLNVLLTAGPKPDQAILIVQMCYIGTQTQGTPFLQALLSCDVERCLLNEVAEKSFLLQQDSVAKVLRGQAGNQWFVMSDLIASLTDEMINETCVKFQSTPPACTWFFELAGGKMADTEDTETCLPLSTRKAAFTVAALHQWPVEQADQRCIDTAAEWVETTLGRNSVGGPLPSFSGRETLKRTVGTYSTENWQRLRQIKNTYDPERMFKHCFWPTTEQQDGFAPPLEKGVEETTDKD